MRSIVFLKRAAAWVVVSCLCFVWSHVAALHLVMLRSYMESEDIGVLVPEIAISTIFIFMLVLICLAARRKAVTAIMVGVFLMANVLYFLSLLGGALEGSPGHPLGELKAVALGTILFVMSLACCVAAAILLKRHGLDARIRWRASVACVLAAGLVYLAWDERLLPPSYSLEDLDLRIPDARASCQELLKLRAVGISYDLKPSQNASPAGVLQYSSSIECAWTSAAPSWSVIEKLKEFDGITDYHPDVRAGNPVTSRLNLNMYTVYMISRIYTRYAFLRMEQGHPADGATKLSTLHAVARKAMRYSTDFIYKLRWLGVIRNNVAAAEAMVASGKCDGATIALFESAFTPLGEDAINMRSVMIVRLIKERDAYGKIVLPENAITSSLGIGDTTTGVWNRVVIASVSPFIFNRNASRNWVDAHFSRIIDECSKKPRLRLGVLQEEKPLRCKYRFKNAVFTPEEAWHSIVYPKVSSSTLKIKIQSDLFAMRLAALRGTNMEMVDDYSGEPYKWDTTSGLPYSVGPDLKSGTSDDIRLGDLPP